MAWSPDPELQQMFLDELHQRSGRLASGARALVAGEEGSVDVSAMRREGHTIKGTARVMGYEAVGSAALMIEQIWDGIADGAFEATAALGKALAVLVEKLEMAGGTMTWNGLPERMRAPASTTQTYLVPRALFGMIASRVVGNTIRTTLISRLPYSTWVLRVKLSPVIVMRVPPGPDFGL